MGDFNYTLKYEIVVGMETDETINRSLKDRIDGYAKTYNKIKNKWQEYAKEFYDKYNVYVSSICIAGHALYHTDWGCPTNGEYTVTFHCTANPEFIHDFELYEKGVLYISKKLKEEFKQHTVTITKLNANICYLTDEEKE